jgi:uncharacterized membrane protein YhaH (DUF805 family)
VTLKKERREYLFWFLTNALRALFNILLLFIIKNALKGVKGGKLLLRSLLLTLLKVLELLGQMS